MLAPFTSITGYNGDARHYLTGSSSPPTRVPSPPPSSISRPLSFQPQPRNYPVGDQITPSWMCRTIKRVRTSVSLNKKTMKNSNTTLHLPLYPLNLILLHLSPRRHLHQPFGPAARMFCQAFRQTPTTTTTQHPPARLELPHLLPPASRIVSPTRKHPFHLGVLVQISNWAITPQLQMFLETESFL